jgi:hypothetical protein
MTDLPESISGFESEREITTNFSSFATNGKIGPFGKSRKVFWHVQNGPKGFLERKRTSF